MITLMWPGNGRTPIEVLRVVGAAVELEEEWPPTHTPAPAPARGRFDVFDRRLCTLVVAPARIYRRGGSLPRD